AREGSTSAIKLSPFETAGRTRPHRITSQRSHSGRKRMSGCAGQNIARITRRMLLTAAGVAAAAPALAEECRIGPSPHEKGPLVWLDYDQVELDAAYD